MKDDLDLTELGRPADQGQHHSRAMRKKGKLLWDSVSRVCCRVLSVGMDYTLQPQTTGNPTFLELFLVSYLSQRGEN